MKKCIMEFVIPFMSIMLLVGVLIYAVGMKVHAENHPVNIEPTDICHIIDTKYCVNSTAMYLNKNLQFKHFNSRVVETCNCN